MEDRNNEQVAEETVEQTEERSAENYSLLEKSGDFGKKVCMAERKTNYIANAILLLFSVIMFVCCFFAGARVQVVPISTDLGEEFADLGDFNEFSGESFTVRQNLIQVIAGIAAFAEIGDSAKQSAYIEECNTKIDAAIEAELSKINIDGIEDEKELAKVYKKVYKKAFASLDINAVKYFVCNINFKSSSFGYYMMPLMMCLVSAITTLACMIAALVGIIKSLVALLSKKTLKKPFNVIKHQFAATVGSYVLLLCGAYSAPSAALLAMLSMCVIFTVLYYAYRCLVVEPWGSFNMMGVIKFGSLFAIALIALLVMGAKIVGFSVENVSGAFNGKAFLNMNIMELGGGYLSYGFMGLWLFYLIITACLGSLTVKTAKRFAEGTFTSKRSLPTIITAMVFMVLITAVLIASHSVEYIQSPYNLVPSVGLIMGLIFCIGFIVVNAVLKYKPEDTMSARAEKKAAKEEAKPSQNRA